MLLEVDVLIERDTIRAVELFRERSSPFLVILYRDHLFLIFQRLLLEKLGLLLNEDPFLKNTHEFSKKLC